MPHLVKESAKYIVTLLAFITGAFALSWCAVYSFWITAHLFRSVAAVRVGDAIAHVILLPARTILGLPGAGLEQMTLLTEPVHYAMINAVAVGTMAYAICRHWIFKEKEEGGG